MAHVCVEPKRRRYSIVQTPVAGKRSTDSSGAPNISHIRKNSDERGEDGEKEREREREIWHSQRAATGTMLTFRKHVRSASTVISVFSEWPESLGPSALLHRMSPPWDSAHKRQRRDGEKDILFLGLHPPVYCSLHPLVLVPRRSYLLTEFE